MVCWSQYDKTTNVQYKSILAGFPPPCTGHLVLLSKYHFKDIFGVNIKNNKNNNKSCFPWCQPQPGRSIICAVFRLYSRPSLFLCLSIPNTMMMMLRMMMMICTNDDGDDSDDWSDLSVLETQTQTPFIFSYCELTHIAQVLISHYHDRLKIFRHGEGIHVFSKNLSISQPSLLITISRPSSNIQWGWMCMKNVFGATYFKLFYAHVIEERYYVYRR